MKIKVMTILSGVILASISAISYIQYKSGEIQQIKLSNSAVQYERSKSRAELLLSNDSGQDADTVLSDILQSNGNIAEILVTNSNGFIEKIGKGIYFRESSAGEEYIRNLIRTNTADGEHSLSQNPLVISNALLKKDYHLFSLRKNNNRAFMLISPGLDRKSVVRMSIEIILITTMVLICTSLLHMIFRRKNYREIADESRIKIIDLTTGRKNTDSSDILSPEEPDNTSDSIQTETFQIDEAELQYVMDPEKNAVKKDLQTKEPDRESESISSMNSNVLSLFKGIKAKLPAISIALYIKKMDGILNKSYELKGKTFLRVDSAVLDCIKISDIKNINQSGAIIADNGQAIKLPIIHDSSLLGLVEIKLDQAATRIDLDGIKTLLMDFSGKIRDYLSINNIIYNRDTGLYSEAYYKMKLDEMNYRMEKTGTGYSVLFIDLFDAGNVPEEKKNTVIKIMQSEIKNSPGNNGTLFHNGEILSMITDNTDMEVLNRAREEIISAVSRFRIKLPDSVVTLKAKVRFETATPDSRA